MTKQFLIKGYKCVVVGKNGMFYEKDEWIKMDGFRQGTQNNLLFGDRLSEEYEFATPEKKNFLRQLVRGEV